MKNRRIRFLMIAALCSATLLPSPSRAADRLILAELFTSQSCSSCPPADALLGDLAQRPGILALSFHVDYWDGLGWKDPFSSPAATARQAHYAEILGAQTYTPQLVVDGRAETVGSDRRKVEALLQRPRAAAISAGIEQTGRHLDIQIAGSPSPGAGLAADIFLVTFDRVHKTPIHGGENGGRYLTTYNDVRSLRAIGAWHGEPIALTAMLGDADNGERAAIIVQSPDGTIWALAATKEGAAG